MSNSLFIEETRGLLLAEALYAVMRFLGALRRPRDNPWRAVFLRKGIEDGP
jgi:hypothetical protein